MGELTFYNSYCIAARAALQKAHRVDEVKEIHDKAEAIRAYARKAGDVALQNWAAEIRLRAERRAGEMEVEAKKRGELKRGRNKDHVTDGGMIPLAGRGITRNQSSKWLKIAAIPEKHFEAALSAMHESGTEVTTTALLREQKNIAREQQGDSRKWEGLEAAAGLPDITSKWYQLFTCDLLDAKVENESVDWIITDPPYPQEFLPVYEKLSTFAARVLKPGGGLICMVGQSYLPEIIASLSKHLRYHWALAYDMLSGQSAQIWERKVNNFWKPLLWFMKGDYSGQWIGDVCKSEANDRRFYHWSQSESGMANIIERLTKPGQSICDPFVGGGTMAVVALQLNRLFVGVDIDAKAIEITKSRIAKIEDATTLVA